MRITTKKSGKNLNKYDIAIVLMIAVCVLSIFFLWLWYDRQNEVINTQLLNTTNY